MSYTTHRSLFTRPVRLLFALALALASILGLASTPAQAASGGCVTDNGTVTCTFNYTGAAETWTVPGGVTQATFDLYGARGSYSDLRFSGKGGRVRATLDVAPGTIYQILVGGTNGFNGGGLGGRGDAFGVNGFPGGGASDVRLSPYALADRILVAGGGGGTAGARGLGGNGGYPAGGNGGGAGGSQIAGGGGASGAGAGSLGQGGAGADVLAELIYGGGGGGGGYYGGGGGSACEADIECSANGGGGGSSYATPAATNVSFENGVRVQHGEVIISYDLESIPPTASPSQSPAANPNGWNNTDVTVDWNWTDNLDGSGVDSDNCTETSTSGGEGEQTLSASCADLGGNQSSATYSVKVDKTAPTLNPVVSPNPVPLGSSATVTANASDSLSGIASQSCAALDTTSAGTKTVTCTANDNAGNTGSASVTYQVIYNFSGFFSPVDNLPTLNTVNAGRAIPVKFSLGGDQGLDIFTAGYPKVQQIACEGDAPSDAIEETVTSGNSGLQYDATTGTYTYVWKTQKSWAGTCRQLIVKLDDGTEHVANFKFK
jgi:hypothetical protein